MPFSKILVVFLGILAILPGATIKAVNATTTTKDVNDVGPECLNYMITSSGETICLDSESPIESEPSPTEPSVGLDCSPESIEAESSSEPITEVKSPSETITETEPASESAAEESSPELLADVAECSPDSSIEDPAPSP